MHLACAAQFAGPTLLMLAQNHLVSRRKIAADFELMDIIVCLTNDILYANFLEDKDKDGTAKDLYTSLPSFLSLMNLAAIDRGTSWARHVSMPGREEERGWPLVYSRNPDERDLDTLFTMDHMVAFVGNTDTGRLFRKGGWNIAKPASLTDEAWEKITALHRAARIFTAMVEDLAGPGYQGSCGGPDTVALKMAQDIREQGQADVTGAIPLCEHCVLPAAEGQKLSRCVRCKAAWYCSSGCQRGGWKFTSNGALRRYRGRLWSMLWILPGRKRGWWLDRGTYIRPTVGIS
jgi:hypothetical protein